MTKALNEIKIVYSYLSPYYKKFSLIYELYYLERFSMYKEAQVVFQQALNLNFYDKQLEGRLYYTGMSIYRGLGDIEKAKKYYLLANYYFSKMENLAMLENLNIKYSILLRSIGELNKALNNDVQLLEDYTIRHYRIRNIEILHNNIAWNYSLLHDYRKAILYYQKALESLKDNDILFNAAYCCYRIGEISQTLSYIELGKKSPSCGEYIYALLEWLECMVKDRYCFESFSILKSILNNYGEDIESNYQTTIKIEIVNYYYYNHMYEEAIHALQPLMGKQLISPSELIFTKKNENRHDFLFSEDEITLRSQMMESDDLFFEDDELGEDEWEELDDSFSRFTHN